MSGGASVTVRVDRPSAASEAAGVGDIVLTARALRSELYHLARLVVVVTGLMNAEAAARRLKAGVSAEKFAPQPLLVLPAVTSGLTEYVPPPAAQAAYQALEAGLEAALAVLKECDALPLLPPVSVRVVAWRRLAALTIAAIGEVDAADELDGLEADGRSSELLLRQLGLVRDGDASLVGPNGDVQQPIWRERRVDRRFVCPQPAWVLRGEVRQRIGLLDISRSGAGFSGISHVVAGERLAIELKDGRRIDGIVMWVARDRCGTRHIQCLADSDPLLRCS